MSEDIFISGPYVVFVYFTDMCIIHLYSDFIIIFLEPTAHLGLIYQFKYKFSH